MVHLSSIGDLLSFARLIVLLIELSASCIVGVFRELKLIVSVDKAVLFLFFDDQVLLKFSLHRILIRLQLEQLAAWLPLIECLLVDILLASIVFDPPLEEGKEHFLEFFDFVVALSPRFNLLLLLPRHGCLADR